MYVIALLFAAQIATIDRNPEVNSAPGTTIISGTFACDDTGTTTALFNSAGALTSDNFMLFPHSARAVIANPNASETAHCILTDSSVATIGQVSSNAQNTITDASGPNGSGHGNVVSIGPLQTFVEVVDYYKLLFNPGARVGLCSVPITGSKIANGVTIAANQVAALDRVRQSDLSVYASCISGECSNVGGTPSGATCLTNTDTINVMLQGKKTVRGQYLKCRCSAAMQVNWRIAG